MRNSIHRMLIRRITISAVIIAVVLNIVVLANELRQIRILVADRGRDAVARFNRNVTHLLDDPSSLDGPALQRALADYAVRGVRQRMGNFVLASLYDLNGLEVARNIDERYPHIAAVERLMESSEHRLADDSKDREKLHIIGGLPYMRVSLPLTNSRGETAAHIEGVFAMTPEAIAALRGRLVRAGLFVLITVLVTAGVLYPIIISLIRRLTKLTDSLLDANLETLKVLGSAVAKRDSDTDVHNYRVTIIAVRLAEAVGLDAREIQRLIKGAFLHDVGKIGIRDNILLKPGKLTDDEYEVMKTHVNHGLDIVRRSEWLEDATDVVGYHHEKYDGTGYHSGLRRDGIPVNARIFAIADVFDALVSRRPYKEPFSFDETMQILEQGRGSHFDPELLDAFAPIAGPLYDEWAGRDDDGPGRELEAITDRYFSTDEMMVQGAGRVEQR